MRWPAPINPRMSLREAKRSAAMDLSPIQDTKPLTKPKALTDEEEEIARLMVYGLPEDETLLGKPIKAGWPLTLDQAAKFMGYRLKRARAYLDPNAEFRGYCGQLLKERRKAELARNLATLIDIRDDPGEGLAADRTVRIKAVAAIEGTEGKSAVVVNVNQQNNTATISPGYVIKLRATQSADPLPLPAQIPSDTLTIEHSTADE